jgi:streptomycin 6-kinase
VSRTASAASAATDRLGGVFVVPPEFIERQAVTAPEADAWLLKLPLWVNEITATWDLRTANGPVLMGGEGVVIPVRRGGERLALKMSLPGPAMEAAAAAYAAWAGEGAAMMLDHDPARGALLLEWLDPGRSLAAEPLFEAAEQAGVLLRRLAVDAPPRLPTLAARMDDSLDKMPGWQRDLGEPVPHRSLALALELLRWLRADLGDRLVHADLHYENILAGEREPWLAVDPRALRGDPEVAVAELLWWRIDEAADDDDLERLLATLVDAAALDPHRARAHALVRAVDYWLWGLQHGLTLDPPRCERLVGVLTRGL